MAKLSAKQISEWKENDKKSSYVRKEWKTAEEDILTLSEYANLINPIYKHVSGNPTIIAKERKDGGYFYKMLIPIGGNDSVEFSLAYKNEFEEDDEIDVNTLQFCTERWGELSHTYVTGEVI